MLGLVAGSGLGVEVAAVAILEVVCTRAFVSVESEGVRDAEKRPQTGDSGLECRRDWGACVDMALGYKSPLPKTARRRLMRSGGQ